MQAFADIVRQGKALYIGVSEWTADQIRDGHALAKELGFQLISNQPQYSMLWRVIEAEVVPGVGGARRLPDRLVAHGPGRAQRQVPARARPARRGQPRHGREGRRQDDQPLDARRRRWPRVQDLKPIAEEAGLSMAQLAVAWVLQNDNVASAIVGASRPEQIAENVKAAGVTIPAELMKRIDDALGDVVERDPGEDPRGHAQEAPRLTHAERNCSEVEPG